MKNRGFLSLDDFSLPMIVIQQTENKKKKMITVYIEQNLYSYLLCECSNSKIDAMTTDSISK